jgi:type IV pilus assembly protein PilA
MGNLTHTEVDLFTMPTAQQLDLPEKGQFSFALDADSDGFSIKFSYEYSVFENMTYVDGYIALVYVGVVAAYAIPAYRDYTVKSKVTHKALSYETEKKLIGEYFSAQGKFPDEDYITANLQIVNKYEYNAETGELTIYFSAADDAALMYDSIVFVPEVSEEDNSIVWECYSTVKNSQMPNYCYSLEE